MGRDVPISVHQLVGQEEQEDHEIVGSDGWSVDNVDHDCNTQYVTKYDNIRKYIVKT